MKKSVVWMLVVLVVVITGIVIFGKDSSKKDVVTNSNSSSNVSEASSPVPVIETVKVSSKTSKYENSELGFAVNYPTVWQVENNDNGVTFIVGLDKTQVSTVATLQADVNVFVGKCAFPAVTTVKDRGTIKIGNLNANMISMSNSVQGRAYFNRMYSIQNGSTCYMFKFTSIAQSPENKGLTGSNIIQAQNNNKAIINATDAEFIEMVKSFTIVQSAIGQDETKAPVKR